jgi:hypothetical protein
LPLLACPAVDDEHQLLHCWARQQWHPRPSWIFDGGLYDTLKGAFIDANKQICQDLKNTDDPVQKLLDGLVLVNLNTIGLSTGLYSWWNSFPAIFGPILKRILGIETPPPEPIDWFK